jgi:chromosome segregation ATPase
MRRRGKKKTVEQYIGEGNVRIGRAMRGNMSLLDRVHELNLQVAQLATQVQNRKNTIFALEAQTDRTEQFIRQAMVDIKADIGIKIVQLDAEFRSADQTYTLLCSTLPDLTKRNRELRRVIKAERARGQDLAQFEVTAQEYFEHLAEEEKENLELMEQEYTSLADKAKVVWLDREIEKVGDDIEVLRKNAPFYGAKLKEARADKDKVLANCAVLTGQVEAFPLLGETQEPRRKTLARLEALRLDEQTAMAATNLLRQKHLGITSQLDSMTALLMRLEVQERQVQTQIALCRQKPQCDLESALDEDENERFARMHSRYQKRIADIDSEAERSREDLRSRIAHIAELKREAAKQQRRMQKATKAYAAQESDLLVVLSSLDQHTKKVEAKSRKLERVMEIHKDVLFETGVIFSSVSLGEAEQEPARELALDQIKAESVLQSAITEIQDDINLLLLEINKERKRRRLLKHTRDGGLEKLGAITERQKWLDFHLTGTEHFQQLSSGRPDLEAKVRTLDREVTARSEMVQSKRASIDTKRRFLHEIETGAAPPQDTYTLPKSVEYFRSWNSRVHRELQRWQTPAAPATLASNLYQWNEILPQSS